MKYLREFKDYLNENFYKWFGNSKMVDEKGEPMVCYHGTNHKFDTFSKNVGASNDEGFYGKGFYFTFGNGKYSESEAGYYGSGVIKVYLKIEKPFIFSDMLLYNDYKVTSMTHRGFVFCYNLAIKFPEIANKIFISKTVWDEDGYEGNVTKAPISVLPKLVEQYKKDLTIVDIDGHGGENFKSGYVKSELVEYDYTESGGKKGSYVDYDMLEKWDANVNKNELEIGLICEAIEKYDGYTVDYHPEGMMTRNPEITDAIKKKGHDGILQSKYGDEVVVFEPNQIKSANDNNGNFDKNSDSILESNKVFEFRNQLEIPFDGKHPLHDKPTHVHILDALHDLDKENGVSIDDYYSDWDISDISVAWEKNLEDGFEEFKEDDNEQNYSYINSIILNEYSPFDYPHYYEQSLLDSIEENDYEDIYDLSDEYEFNSDGNIRDFLVSSDKVEDIINYAQRELFDNFVYDYNCLETLKDELTEDGLIPLYRAINYGKDGSKDVYLSILEYSSVGVFWSFEYDGAIAHNGGSGDTYILCAYIKPEYINWTQTIFKNAWSLRDEKEVELLEEVDIMIYSIIDSRTEKELKHEKPFIVKT